MACLRNLIGVKGNLLPNRFTTLLTFKSETNLRCVCKSSVLNNDEVEKAQNAADSRPKETIFAKIIDGTVPTKIIYRDEHCIAFHDTSPQAPVHFLVIPIKPLAMLDKSTENDKELLGHLLLTAKKVAAEQNLMKGYRLVINNGVHGSQSVYHLHLHVLGGRQMKWPPG